MTEELIDQDGVWLRKLDNICLAGYKFDSNISLPVSVACRSLLGWLEDPRKYNERQHKSKWEYVIDDLALSISVLGISVVAKLESVISATQEILVDLPDNRHNRDSAIANVSSLLKELSKSEVLVAAWRDLVSGCKQDAISANDLDMLAATFWDMAECNGLQLESMGIGYRMSGVLSDNAFEVAVALADLGDRNYPTFDEYDIAGERSNITSDERLIICERLLSLIEPSVSNIVLLALERAFIKKAYFEYGPLTLFESEWLYGNLFENGPHRSELPVELLSDDVRLSKHDLPHDANVVIARVNLGSRSRVHAVRDARNLIESLLALAVPGAQDWKLLGGYVHIVNSRNQATGSFIDTHLKNEYSRTNDHTPYELERLKSDFLVTVPNSTTEWTKALEAKKWINSTLESDNLTKVLTGVRAIEQSASWVRGGTLNWHKFATLYLAEEWAQLSLHAEINDTVFNALRNTGCLTQEKINKLNIFNKIIMTDHDQGYEMNLLAAIDSIDQLATIYNGTSNSSQLEALSLKLTTSKAISTELDSLLNKFDIKMKRLITCRDSAQHGGPIDLDVVSSVVDFSISLAHIAIWRALRAVLEGVGVEEMFNNARNDTAQRHINLRDGGDKSLLFK